MNWYEKIGHQLFEPNRDQSPGELIFFKIFELFVLIYTIKYAWEWGIYTELRNTEVVLPLGIANYIDISIFFDWNLALINAAVITLLSVIAFARMGLNWFYMAVMVLLHIQYVARFSQGEIPHSMNLIGMSVLCFAIGSIWFPDKKQMPRFVIGSTIFFIGLGYTSAFFAKLIGTGINWFDGRHLWLWISEKSIDVYSTIGYYEPNFLQELALNHLPVASLILLIGWLTELIGFTMWWKKIRPYTTMMLIGMHVGITLTMNIRFDAFVMQLILIGFPWYLLIDRFVKSTPKWIEKMV
ncbi:hypothetical protein [Rhodohalobacter halophilus]|uniref:hypothetical protein n=1 Tax=Rhodohalobacter halophilus TaxID=1812810 RepID=UPI00083FD1BC|nr:hypothetical protein [Rhodohalobacter halophilus]